jgi:Sporulation and spore germination
MQTLAIGLAVLLSVVGLAACDGVSDNGSQATPGQEAPIQTPSETKAGQDGVSAKEDGDDQAPPFPPAHQQTYDDDEWNPRERTPCSQRLGIPGDPSPGRAIGIYFTCDPRNGPYIQAALARYVAWNDSPLRTAIDALLAGPTTAEEQAGFVSNFGSDSGNIRFGLEIKDGIAIVDFERSILRRFIFAAHGVLDVAQIVSTAGQFPSVEGVVIRVGGKPLCRATGECLPTLDPARVGFRRRVTAASRPPFRGNVVNRLRRVRPTAERAWI